MITKTVTTEESIENIDNGTFIYCKELCEGFLKTSAINTLGITDWSFVNVLNTIKDQDLTTLETNKIDGVEFGDNYAGEDKGAIIISQQQRKRVKNEITAFSPGRTQAEIEEKFNYLNSRWIYARHILSDSFNNVEVTASINLDNITEGQNIPVEFTVSGYTFQDITVVFNISGTASTGDYIMPNTSVIIPANELSKVINISTVNDTLVENTETFGIEIIEVLGGSATMASSNISDTINILDNDYHANAINDSVSLEQDSSINIAVLSNDIPNSSGSKGNVISVSTPLNGTATINSSNNTITYTPDSGYSGSDSFTYTTDENDSATVSITVTATTTGSSTDSTVIYNTNNMSGGSITYSNNIITLSGSGLAGSNYGQIWASINIPTNSRKKFTFKIVGHSNVYGWTGSDGKINKYFGMGFYNYHGTMANKPYNPVGAQRLIYYPTTNGYVYLSFNSGSAPSSLITATATAPMISNSSSYTTSMDTTQTFYPRFYVGINPGTSGYIKFQLISITNI